MGLRGWLAAAAADVRERPLRGLGLAGYRAYLAAYYAATTRRPLGECVYDRPWDVLVVLDACRVDALRAVAPEYDFLGDVSSYWSLGSRTSEWAAKTFAEPRRTAVARTTYVAGNGFTEKVLGSDAVPPLFHPVPFDGARWATLAAADFAAVHDVWRLGPDDPGVVPPRVVTDAAIRAGRTADPERLVVHYNQPHAPFLGRAAREGREPTAFERDPWPALRRGDRSREEAWAPYLDNLRYALDEVAVLVENVAGTVAVTADHGELFGELSLPGTRGLYAHPGGVPHPAVKRVPWATATATDEGTREPDLDLAAIEGASADVEAHLRELGYLP